jgi:hypothetical protein
MDLTSELDAALQRAFKAISKTRRHARLHLGRPGAPGTGELKCPACDGGRLAYEVEPGGKIRGRCSTPGCVSWYL